MQTKLVFKKNSAAPRFLNPLLIVGIPDETLLLVFDLFRQFIEETKMYHQISCLFFRDTLDGTACRLILLG